MSFSKALAAVLAGVVVLWVAGNAGAGNGTFTEDFETGYTLGSTVGTHADWYDGGGGPVVNSGIGVAGSIGLAPAGSVFIWTAHPFDWNDAAFPGTVVFQMDYESDSNGSFDDDRCIWNTSDTSTSSSYNFGAQLDTSDGGIVTYWRDASGNRIQDTIVAFPTIKADTWYRFRNEISKLTATSARLDVSLVELDASGNPTGPVTSGAVADTSLWGGGSRAPASSYFTVASMWPAYKNYSAIGGDADNARYEIVPEPFTLSLLGIGGLALLRRRRCR